MIRNKGFTLIEVLVVSVTLAALGLAIIGLQQIISESRLLIWTNYLSVDEANSMLQEISRELRTARAGDDGSYLLQQADDRQIVFFSDIDYDGQTEKIRYTLQGNTLEKGITGPTEFPVSYLAENEKVKILTNKVLSKDEPSFYYYNCDWPEDTVNNPLDPAERLSKTRLIKIYLDLQIEEDQPDNSYILESLVQIRMLKENL